MGDEPFTTQQTTSSPRSAPSRSPHQAAYAAERAKLLFGCYRRGDANDPDTYVAAVAAVLARYDTDLIREVTDPNTGIQATEKYMTFMPNAGELKIYCEGLAARKERLQRLGSLPAPDLNRARLAAPARLPGDMATVFVPASNAHYQALLDWSKTADPRLFKFEQRPGIWVSFDTWENRKIGARAASGVTMVTGGRLGLSEEVRRAMEMRDAERNRQLPIDMPQEFVD